MNEQRTTVRRITAASELAALEVAWNALADGIPLRSWDWLATWWNYYGAADAEQAADQQLFVLAVYDDKIGSTKNSAKTLIGIAPWFLDRSAIKGSVIRFLGSGEVCTDHLSLICRPEESARVAAAIAGFLTASCDDWDLVELNAIDADDGPITALLAALEERECIITRHATDQYWVLDLPASWEEYLASISKSHRKQLRQLERRVLESNRARWHRVTNADDLPHAWDKLVDLHQRRRLSLGEPGCFASRAFHDFHREVVTRLIARNQLRMSWLELDGTPAAAEYHLADATTTYAYQGGVDPDRLGEEPGRLSTILCLRAAIDEGHRKLDFMRGDEPYKAHWRATPHPTFDCRVVPNRRLARLRGRVLNLGGAVTDWIKQVGHAVPDIRS
jgi:CelD/BcsL family acetyltransferase involved in cellulose biosynthesis